MTEQHIENQVEETDVQTATPELECIFMAHMRIMTEQGPYTEVNEIFRLNSENIMGRDLVALQTNVAQAFADQGVPVTDVVICNIFTLARNVPAEAFFLGVQRMEEPSEDQEHH